MSGDNFGFSSQDQFQLEKGKRRSKPKAEKKPSFVGKFNERTHKLIELSRSNSCSALPILRRDSDCSIMSNDATLSQSSNSGVSNREKFRQKRLKERMDVKPLNLSVEEKNNVSVAAKEIYDQLLNEKSSIDAFDILLATLRTHLPGQHWWLEESDGETHVRLFIRNYLLTSAENLADKYLTRSRGAPLNKKLDEYKLQTLLHMFALLPETEDADVTKEEEIDKVVDVLRMISSASEAGALQAFLNEDVLETFVHRVPRHLARLYEDLNQPFPPELSSYACEDNEDGEFDPTAFFDSPKLKSGLMVSNVSERPRLARRASFLDSRHHKLVTIPSSGVKQLKLKGEKKESNVGAKKEKGRQARRSLTFESHTTQQRTPKKSSGTNKINKDSPRTPKRTPKRTRSGAAIVQETPVHKQRPLSEYRREQFKRVSGNTVRQVVAETPQKSMLSFMGNRKSPRQRKSARTSCNNELLALTQVDEENRDEAGTSSCQPTSTSTASEPLVELSISKIDRRRTFLKEFLTGHDSPKKRVGKVVRQLASPSSKSSFGQDVANNDFGPFLRLC